MPLSDFTDEELKQEMARRGFAVRVNGECPTCEQIIVGPHYCPGPHGERPPYVISYSDRPT